MKRLTLALFLALLAFAGLGVAQADASEGTRMDSVQNP